MRLVKNVYYTNLKINEIYGNLFKYGKKTRNDQCKTTKAFQIY